MTFLNITYNISSFLRYLSSISTPMMGIARICQTRRLYPSTKFKNLSIASMAKLFTAFGAMTYEEYGCLRERNNHNKQHVNLE
jgi:hypothetical protein